MTTTRLSAISNSGWGWPENARKAHYFSDTRSLCGRWAFFGLLSENQEAGHKSDCPTCAKKLETILARSRPAAEKESK